MRISEFIARLERDFFARLDKKTGWGKDQVKEEFRKAKAAVALKMLETNKR
ncbi:MAG: hypothetical protein J7J52_04805 [Deltaproteobacteria bacterium]|nr:hypothetical protein [Deltaproteobacteria bacterium]